MLQTVGIQVAPLADILRQEGVVITRHIRAGRGIEPAASIFGDEATELVGDGIVGSAQTQLIDVLLNGRPAGFNLFWSQAMQERGIRPAQQVVLG